MRSFPKFSVRLLVQVALLVAVEIVLSRFLSIATPVVKIGFGFLPLALCGMLFGPVWAGVAGALADLLGALLFPIGAYFPGFTLSAALTGVVFGLFLYGNRGGWPALLAAAGINCLGISLLLSTGWVAILTGTPYWAVLPTRALQATVMLPVQIITLRLLRRPAALLAART